jgi:hypothetical protein
MMTLEERAKGERLGIRAQLTEFVVYLNDVGAKSRLLSAKLGTNPKADEEGDPTIWEAMAELDSEFRIIKLIVKNLPQAMKETQNILDKYGIEVQTMDTNMYKHYKSHLHSSNSRMVNLEQTVSNLQHSPRPQAQDGDFDFDHTMQEPNAALQAEVSKLRQEMEEMRHQGRSAQTLGEDTPASSLFPPTSLDEIKARLAVVEARQTITGESLSLGGTSFPSEMAVSSYIGDHDIPSCAMYWDLFSVMVCMGGRGLTGKERSDKIYSAERGRTGSALEGDLVASMTHKRPLCLYGEGLQLARLDQGVAMCKTYEHWIGGGSHVSYRAELSAQIRVYTDGILGRIGTPHSPAHHLAHVLLSQVTMQWNSIVGFIDMLYLDLVAKCKFDSVKAWKLVAVCVAAIFEATQPFRSKVILLEDSTSRAQKASFMWATFQTHRVIQTFIAVQFQSHPSIVTEISLFMVRERVDPKEIEDLSAKCRKAKESAAKATMETKKLLESHTDFETKARCSTCRLQASQG